MAKFTISKLDKLKAELGRMASVDRRHVGDYIRYLNIVEAKSAAPAKARTRLKKPKRTARVSVNVAAGVRIAPSHAQVEAGGTAQ